MKKILWILLIIGFSQNFGLCEMSVSGATITAVALIIPGTLVDNFNDGSDPNFWGGVNSTFSNNGTVTAAYDDILPNGGTGKSLAMAFDLPAALGYSGCTVTLSPGGAPVNIQSYKYLEFYVRGSVSSLSMKVELHNASGDPARSFANVYIRDYLGGGISTAWQRVQIPLDAFVNLDSLSNATSIVFTFEHDYNSNNSFPNSGTIFIDDLSFSASPVLPVKIDVFGRVWGTDAMGGNVGAFSGGGASHNLSYASNFFNSNPNSSSSTYNVTNGFAGIYFIFGNGFSAVPHDFSQYSKIRLWVKAESAGQSPLKFKMELIDGSGAHSAFIPDNTSTPGSPISDVGQTYEINLASFAGLNPGTIQQMNIVYEDFQIGPQKNGTLYYDDIEFIP